VTPTHRLSDRIIWLVGRASLRAQRLIQEQFMDGELRKAHYGILASLADLGPAAQAPLADRVTLDRSDMVSYLDDLEDRGLVTRTADTADRRRKIVEITPCGRAALRELDKLVFAADDELLAGLTPAEQATLAGLLTRIIPQTDQVRLPTPGLRDEGGRRWTS
jgi:DNA-binding MarR family transcriptional regulator